MALSTDQFRDHLTASGLLSAEDLSALLAALPEDKQPQDGEQLAKELVKQKKLTKYQAEQIYAGKGKTLVLGNYVILDKLGQGGMGMVLKAEHKRMKRLVAIKVMSPAAVKTPDALKRFHREVEAAAKLRHPNIVAADDADEAKGTHFLVMEYVDGSDLAVRVKRQGPLPVEEAIRCTIQAARGLEFAHEQGVIHRDIKPANLLMDAKGNVKILDMGLARIDGSIGGSSEGAGLTNTGTIMGTVDYMSPEQAMDTKHADARSDIYSLGCSLYYLLTGKVVYDGDTMMKKLMAHQNGAIPSLTEESRKVNRGKNATTETLTDINAASLPDLDASGESFPALEAVFRRMVAKRPEDRPQSMTEVIAELERCLPGGSPTVSYIKHSAPGSSATVPQLQKELSGISSAEVGSPTIVSPKAEAIADSEYSETMISSAGEVTTDPHTEQTLTAERAQLMAAGEAKKSRTKLLGAIVAAVVLLVTIGLAVRGKPPSPPSDKEIQANGIANNAISNSAPSGDNAASSGVTADFALDFDGKGSHVRIPGLRAPDAPCTVEAIVTPRVSNAGMMLVSSKDHADGNLMAIPGGWAARRHGTQCVSNEGIAEGQRVHLTCVWDGVQCTLFINGQPQAGFSEQPRVSGQIADVVLGGYLLEDGRTNFFFDGQFHQVRFSKTARYREAFTAPSRMTADGNTLAIYNFDEGAGDVLKDSSGNNHHGKIVGAKWVKTAAPSKYGLDFNVNLAEGTARVECPYSLDPSKPSTIELYVTLRSTCGPDANRLLFKVADRLVLKQRATGWVWDAAIVDKGIYARPPKLLERVHLAGVSQGGELRLYENGKLLGEITLEKPLESSPNMCHIGGHSVTYPGWEPLDGAIDQVRLSNIARYVQDFSPPHRMERDQDTQVLYNFDEGQGDVLKDSSGNNHHGKIVGAKWGSNQAQQAGSQEVPALEFDGAGDYVELPRLTTKKEGPVTVEAWVAPAEWNHQAIINVSGRRPLSLYTDKGVVGFWCLGRGLEMPAPAALLGEPVHVAGVYDDQVLTVFLNGVPSPPIAPLVKTADESLMAYIGATRDWDKDFLSFRGFFKGRMYQIRVSQSARYTQAFKPQRILETDPDTLAIYQFSEGTGDILKDSSGNNHHGKIIGAKWVRSNISASAMLSGDPDRRAAKYVLSIGGRVRVKGATLHLKAGDELPQEMFQLSEVDLNGNAQVSDAGLASFKGCKHLAVLNLNVTSVSDVGLANFQDCKELISLGLDKATKVTDAGLAHFKDCKELVGLSLRETQASDVGMANFKGCRKLVYLSLAATKVTDAGLVHFKDCKDLEELILYSTSVTDAGLANFKDCKKWKTLWLENIDLSDAALANFNDCKDLQTLRLECKKVTAQGLANFKDCQELKALVLHNVAREVEPGLVHFENCKKLIHANFYFPLSDAGLSHFKGCKSLTSMELGPANISEAGFASLKDFPALATIQLFGANVNDISLQRLRDCKSLTNLELSQTSVTANGIAELTKALPQCRINWDGKIFEAAKTPSAAVAPFDTPQARAHQEAWAKYLGVPVDYTNSIGMKFVLIPPGEFMMGSTAAEIDEALKDVGGDKHWQECIKSEAPQHKVILTQPIYLGVNEVTQSEYEKVMGLNPSHFAPMGTGKEVVAGMKTAEHPVERVSWNDATEFCAKLSQQEKLKPFDIHGGKTITPLDGTGYRLPSEAEWEFACRAGTSTKFWIGDDEKDLMRAGWFVRNSGSRTHSVGESKANPFGLYDTHGNVWEWIQDGWNATWYSHFREKPAINPNCRLDANSLRVVRGGDWFHPAYACRLSYRHAADPNHRDDHLGFRVSLSVDAVKHLSLKVAMVPPLAIAPFDIAQACAHQEAWAKHLGVPVEYTNAIGMKFVLIPPGELKMGEGNGAVDVKLTRPFRLGKYEVTQAEYREMMKSNPSHFSKNGSGKESVVGLDADKFPIENVTWEQASEFCRTLTEQERNTGKLPVGWAYALPSEAEWEHACRAGTPTAFSFGDQESELSKHGWAPANSEKRTHEVGQKLANPWGLHDMHGNVWEWCQDWFAEQLPGGIDPRVTESAVNRVHRGGSWLDPELFCRSAYRNQLAPDNRSFNLGFRVALVQEAPPPAKAPFDAQQARAHQETWAKHLGTTVETTNSVGAKMILIPPGEFLMGAPDDDSDAQPQEKPRHQVKLTKPFCIGATEVTIGQFRKFVEATKYVTQAESDGKGAFLVAPKERQPDRVWNRPGSDAIDEHPVRYVSWEDARQFCKWLSRTEGATYRLPTDAEWEYACRAGTDTRYWFGDAFDSTKANARRGDGSGSLLAAVGSLTANPFGLFDMHGNVHELCLDSPRTFTADAVIDPLGREGETVVVRSGAAGSGPSRLRSSQRYVNDRRQFPETDFATLLKGFRVVREVDVPTAEQHTELNRVWVGKEVVAEGKPWVDWLGPKLKRGDFDVNPDGWIREGEAISTERVISGIQVMPGATRNGALRLTYLLRDSKGVQINARDHKPNKSDAMRDVYVAEDNGQQLRIVLFRAGAGEKNLAIQAIPSSLPKDAPRTLEFRVIGNTLTATLNGSVVATVNDSTIAAGDFALVALKGVLIQTVQYQELDEPASKPAVK